MKKMKMRLVREKLTKISNIKMIIKRKANSKMSNSTITKNRIKKRKRVTIKLKNLQIRLKVKSTKLDNTKVTEVTTEVVEVATTEEVTEATIEPEVATITTTEVAEAAMSKEIIMSRDQVVMKSLIEITDIKKIKFQIKLQKAMSNQETLKKVAINQEMKRTRTDINKSNIEAVITEVAVAAEVVEVTTKVMTRIVKVEMLSSEISKIIHIILTIFIEVVITPAETIEGNQRVAKKSLS
jgi:hypothetical protein